MLEQGLSVYCDNKKKIKYRLIPFVYLLFICLTISLFTGLDICAAQKPAVIEGKDKWLFFALDGSIADFQGKNHLSQQQMERYLTSMQELTLTGAVLTRNRFLESLCQRNIRYWIPTRGCRGWWIISAVILM